MTEAAPIGFVGLGAMGSPIAAALQEAGHALAVHDRRPETMRPLVEGGARACGSVAEVGDVAETVLVSLPSPAAVHDVACGPGGLLGCARFATFVDLSTTGPSVSEQIAQAFDEPGVAYLDAPVSGGVAGAEARTLTVMTSGEPALLERLRPLLDAFAGTVFWVGAAPGQGQTAKLLNNLLSATALAITSEAMTVGVRAGLDPATLLEVFNASSGQNTATSNKFPKHVLTRRFGAGFRLGLMAKDVELCLSEARRSRVPMLVGGLVQQLWTLAAGRADAEADHTEIVRLFEEWAGVTVATAEEARDAAR